MFLDLPARLAKTLLRMSSGRTGRRILLSQRELGNIVGSSRESINKCLRQWQRKDDTGPPELPMGCHQGSCLLRRVDSGTDGVAAALQVKSRKVIGADAHHGHAILKKLICRRQGTVAADAHQKAFALQAGSSSKP